MKKTRTSLHSTRLAVTTAIASAMLMVYGRSAYAGTCVQNMPGIWVCSNAAGVDATQNMTGTPLTVTTSPDFGITTAAGNALDIQGTNGTSFTDVNASVISSGNATGIYAANSMSGDLTLSTDGTVTGGTAGIAALNTGTGATSVTATGTVTGTNSNGIIARNYGTDLTINTAAVSGNGEGISAYNYGTGATSVTATGTVTGTNCDGLDARNNSANSTNLTITAVDVSGGTNGIRTANYGTGATSITSTGLVTGTSYSGIVAYNYGTDLTITAVDVTGGTNGIRAVNGGTGTTTVSVSGTITGGSTAGIATYTLTDSLSTINVAATAVVGAVSGDAIVNNSGDSLLTIAAGGLVNGTVRLNDGDDTVNVAGGTNLSGITALDGGDDVLLADGFIDTLNLNTSWSGSLDGATVLNWELININGGTVDFSNAAITAGQINVNNLGTLNGSNNLAVTGDVAIALGSRVIAGNATGTNVMGITGNLSNSGSVQLTGPAGQQVAGDRLNVAGNYIGNGGQVVLDTVLGDDASATDRLVVAGSTSGSTGIFVNNVGGLGVLTTGDGIMVVDVAGASAANAFSLSNTVTAGAFNYQLFQNGLVNPADGDWYLRSSARGITAPAMVVPFMGSSASLSILGTLQERLAARSTGMEDGGAWLRVVGNAGSQTHQTDIGDFEGRSASHVIQAGADFMTTENGTRFGAFAAKTLATTRMFDASINPDVEAGRATLDGYAVGAYATHYGDNYYWDAVIQHAWLDATASSNGESFDTDNKNWLASFEFGRAFTFGDNNALEPQAQIIVGKNSTDDANDGVTSYDYTGEDTLLARLGVRWSHAKDQGAVKGSFVPYLKANVWHNFGDDSFVQIGGVSDITTERNDTWAEVGAGFSVLTQNNWSFFMQYDYENGLGQSDRENHSATLGLRRNW